MKVEHKCHSVNQNMKTYKYNSFFISPNINYMFFYFICFRNSHTRNSAKLTEQTEGERERGGGDRQATDFTEMTLFICKFRNENENEMK